MRIFVLKRNCKIIFVAKNVVMSNLIYKVSHSMTPSKPGTMEGRNSEMLLSAYK
jgi:hypothetical protein